MQNDALAPASNVEILENAYQLLYDRGVSRGAYARDLYGEVTGTYSPEADCFCVVGAIAFSHSLLTGEAINDLQPIFHLFAPFMDEGKITTWNDDASEAEILSVIRAAINYEKSRILDELL